MFALVWVGVRGALAARHLVAASSAAQDLAVRFDAEGIFDEGIAVRLIAETSAARDLTSDPVWYLASLTPWLGPQLAAAAAAANAADIAASEALPVLVAQGSIDLASLIPQGGRIDTAAVAVLQEPLSTASDALSRSAAALEGVQTRALVPPLAEQVDNFRVLIDGAATGADAAHRASILAPDMLGSDRPRTYLLLFQNNAEWRSLGGIPGQVAHVTAAEGRITLDQIVASSAFPDYEESLVPLTDEVDALFESRPGRWMQNVTQVPDFEVSAQLASAMWESEYGEKVDGVFAMDVVTLSYLLNATGPIALPSGDTVSSNNAVPLLLNEVYFRYPSPADQDDFFGAVAGTVFTTLTAGSPQPAPLLAALSRAGEERRLLAWIADPDEQAIIEGTSLAGNLPRTDSEQAEFGVFLNDGTGSKMSYYLTPETDVRWEQCTDELNTATVTVAVSNGSPSVEQLPDYVTGGGMFGVPAGVARTFVYVYLPEGYELIATDLSENVTTAGGYHDGRHVVTLIFDQIAGDMTTTTMSLTAQGPSASVISAAATPTINPLETATVSAHC